MENIYDFFTESVQLYPENICLKFENEEYSYKEINSHVNLISNLLNSIESDKYIGIIGQRSLSAYLGILGTLKTGRAYIPLNPKQSVGRIQEVNKIAGIYTFIVDKYTIDKLGSIFSEYDSKKINLIFPENEISELRGINGLNRFNVFTKQDIENHVDGNKDVITNNSLLAYILFTSGTTGTPKGVPIPHKSVIDYVNFLKTQYLVTNTDRVSQIFDLTFDLSVHDLWICWSSGATLCIPNYSIFFPLQYIKKNNLTVWFSVPSVGIYMDKFKQLKEKSFPELRLVLFCGEPLPANLAESFQKAAENATVVNLYGPTEATIAISNYKWLEHAPNKIKNGIVSIGKIFETQQYCIINENNQFVSKNTPGELYLKGSQVITDYLNHHQNRSNHFIEFPGKDYESWYKTGDIVLEDDDNDLYYLFRKDFQVKIQGYRIELEEVNDVVRKFTKSNHVVSTVFPLNETSDQCIYTFVDECVTKTDGEIYQECEKKLPSYAIPKAILYLKDFPLNINGKIDRKELNKIIENYLLDIV